MARRKAGFFLILVCLAEGRPGIDEHWREDVPAFTPILQLSVGRPTTCVINGLCQENTPNITLDVAAAQ